MNKQYIEIPKSVSLKEIKAKNYSFSATQYKTFCVANKNLLYVRDFLSRDLERTDLGSEVGSEAYVEQAPCYFLKTKALQPETFLVDTNKEAIVSISPKNFIKMDLEKGDIIISKDSNVGEIAYIHKDLPNTMLCGGIYKLPVTERKFYLLAFIKSNLFRQQIDFLVPRGSTIRHGKTKFLDCQVPMPSKNSDETIAYVELLTEAIINKEIEIQKKHDEILNMIHRELEDNQNNTSVNFSHPTLSEVLDLDRMDACLYSKEFKSKEALIKNYKHGSKTVSDMGFKISRGQNLQVSNIGNSVQTPVYHPRYYTLILPKYISKYGTVVVREYLGNPNDLKVIQKGDIIFGAEGNEKGRSIVVIEDCERAITNIHGITLNQQSQDVTKGVFVKLFLDYYRSLGLVDAYAVGGNGGSLAIKYWKILKFPTFPEAVESSITALYHNKDEIYNSSACDLSDFLAYDNAFNQKAGIYEIDKSLKYLKSKLDHALDSIANDKQVQIIF